MDHGRRYPVTLSHLENMGMIADRFAAQLARLREIDEKQNQLIQDLLNDTNRLLKEHERLANQSDDS